MHNLQTPDVGAVASDWRGRFAAVASLLGWLLLAGLVASRYIGHSSSPYGVCYAASGRSVPCELMPR